MKHSSNSANPHSVVSDGSDSDFQGELNPLALSPITIAGHTWCDVREVEYHIWVKDDGVLDLDDPSTVGVSDQQMCHVTNLICF